MLSLKQANELIQATFDKGSELRLQPLSVAILDPGGHLISFQRQDNASTMRPQIATGKATGALSLGVSSRRLAEMSSERPAFVNALCAMSKDGLVPAAGGLIVIDSQNNILGAIGVTGDTSDNDELCAASAIGSVGLKVLV